MYSILVHVHTGAQRACWRQLYGAEVFTDPSQTRLTGTALVLCQCVLDSPCLSVIRTLGQ